MKEIIKHINDTNASYRDIKAGDAKNTDLFLDNEHYALFEGCGEQIKVRFDKDNLSQAILFIASILPRKYDNSSVHKTIQYSASFVMEQLAILDSVFTENGKPVQKKIQIWNARKDVPQKNGKIDTRFYFNGLIEDVLYSFNGQQEKGKFTIRNYVAGSYSDLHILKSDDGFFDVYVSNVLEPYNDGKDKDIIEEIEHHANNESFQQIFYGAPGTGKSYTINETTKGEDVIRTTFHPDSDYATFVGAYKPTTIEETVMTVIGTKAVPVEDKDGKERKEAKIVYEFVAQAFLQAYVEAWKKYADTEGEPKKQYLVIEEINRGNCAQIFGDLFQLLDRNDSGFSDYPIKADADMKRQLKKAFEGLELTQKEAINALYDGRNVADEVLNGEILLLPNNLYIWATMNTSDQSLFPIDSAFKRRWDWNYMPISDAHLNWTIEAGNNSYDWWSFLQKINEKIGSTTNSEDKKLGYFFCKASNGTISAQKFVGKVVFYLWNDVFKDYEFSDSIFDDNDGSKLTFDKFYTAEGRNSKVVTEKVALFLDNLGVDVVQIADQEDEVYNGQDENEVIEEADLKPIERKRYEFWNTFLEYAHQNSEFTQYFSGIKKATKDYWKNFFVPGMDFSFAVLQQRKYGAIDLLVYFRETTDTYKHLFSRRTDIENEMGVNYEWNELPDKKASFINERRENVDFDNKDSWTGLFDFIIARLIRMREVFTKYSND